MSTPPRVSVVVPTRDRPDALSRCLAALARQTEPALEVIVVDDRSRARGDVAHVVATAPGARLLHGDGKGPAAARNRGAQDARGAVVCFLDDDCEPLPSWLELVMHGIDGGADAVAGRTVNAVASPLAAASQAIASGLSDATLDRATGELGFAPSCNIACRAEVAERVPFDERFPAAAGEDREWCLRLRARGYRLVAARDALVMHHHELSPAGFLRQHARYGRGAHRFRRATRATAGMSRGAAGGGPAPRLQARLVWTARAEGWAAASLVAVAQLATAAGYALEAGGSGRERWARSRDAAPSAR